MKTMRDLFSWAPKSLGDCSHESKRCLLLGRKATANLDSVLKSRDITLRTKVHLVKAMVFPVVTYGCESSTIKKAEHQKVDAFELWCWRRLSRIPWPARKSNQSIQPVVKNLPAVKETQVRFLGEEDPLEMEMATHSSIFA